MNSAEQINHIVRRTRRANLAAAILKRVGLGLFLVLISLTAILYTRAGERARVYAAVPATLNFQARLLNTNGAIVADGNYSVEFKLYTAPSGGVAAWTETQTTVPVKSGYMSVYLGSVNTTLGALDWSQQYHLTMNVNADGEMNPRLQLTSVPYAFRSGQADTLTNGAGTLGANDLAQLAPAAPQVVNSALAALRLNQTGAGMLAQFQGNGSDVFTLAKNGDVTSGGSATFSGGTLNLGSATQIGGLVLHDGTGITGTLKTTTLTATRTYTLPDASGTICLTTTCSGAAGAFVNGGNSFGTAASIGTNDNFALSFRTNNLNRLTLGTDGNLDLLTGGLLINGTSVISSGRVLQNVTANTSILTSGILGNARGGTGLDTSLASNGQLLIGNGTGFSLAALTNNGGLIVTNSSGGIGLAVNYGALANMSVQGNTTLICPSGTGNLSGTGNTITLGTGGTCNSLNTNTAVTFSTSVTTPLVTNAGPLTLSTTGLNDLTLTSGSGLLHLNASTLRRTAAGATTFDLSDIANTSLDFTNSGLGVLNMSVDGSATFGGGLTVSSGGASIAGDVLVNGGLKVGNTFTAEAGMIRWTGLDFQGYDGTTWKSLTSGGGGGGSTTVVEAGAGITKIKGSDQIVTASTALVNDNDLFVPIAANETRTFRFVVHATSNAQADLKFAVTAPLGASCAVAVSDVSTGSGNVACGTAVFVTGTGTDSIYEITGSVTNSLTEGTIQLQWAQSTSRATLTTVYARSFVHSTSTTADVTALTHYKQGGNAFGATGVIGTLDAQNFDLVVNNSTVLNLATSGLATFSGGVTTGGLLTVSSGGANITGGLDLNSGGITNAGNILGVGTNITAAAGLTIASSGAGNLALNSASGLAILGATTLRTADSLVFDLQKATDSALTLQNSGAGIVNLNLSDGGLQTAGTLRLTNGGALQNINGLSVISGGASITGNVTLGGSSTDRLTINGQILGATPLVFQGATDNSFTTTISVTNPTGSNTLILPDASGTLVLDSRSIQTAAGSGLTGGGNLSADRSLSLDINGLNSINTANNGDYLAVYDSNTASIKKVSRSDFLQGVIGALRYLGAWDASTNTPVLSDATGASGDEYVVSVGGTRNLGSGAITFGPGDFIIHNGTKWEVAPSSADINSVFGRTGAITAQSGDYSALQITNTPSGNIAAFSVQAALNELDNEKLGSLNGLTGGSQTFANDANITISSSGSVHTLSWSGQLSVGRGGTGAATFTSNGIMYGNGSGALQVTAAGTGGQLLLANAAGVPTFTSLSGDVTIDTSGVTTIGPDRVTLGADTSGSYISSLGALTGLSVTGNSGEGSTPALSVIYGSIANSAVRGNTTLTCPSGTGNLNGGGTVITLGTGGTCGSLNTNSAVIFTTSVTTPLYTSSSGLSITSGGSGDITLDSASGILMLAADDTTLQRVAAGTYTIDLNDAGTTTLSLTNSGTGVANLDIALGGISTAGVLRLTNAGALQNISTISASGAITTSGGNILINNTANSYQILRTGVTYTGMDVNCSSNNFLGSINVRGGIVTSGSCENDDSGLSDSRLKENITYVGSVLDQFKNLNVVNYNFKCDDPAFESLNLGCEDQAGVLAQELAQIFPELVSQGADGYYRVKQRSLQFYNLKAVSEISTKLSSNGDARLSNVSTGDVLRLNSNGSLQNITGLNLVSGGATIAGGINNNSGGITNAGAILGATTISGQNLTLAANTSDNLLTLTKDGKGVFTVFNNGALGLQIDAANAFGVENSAGMSVFNIDTQNGKIMIGSGDTAKTVLFVLDSRSTVDDPAGTNGASYYNAASDRFRCFQNDKWQDCLPAGDLSYPIASDNVTWSKQSLDDQEFPGTPRTTVNTDRAHEFRLHMRLTTAGAASANCRLQYATTDAGPWKNLSSATNSSLSIGQAGTLKTGWLKIADDARTGDLIIRVICQGGDPGKSPSFYGVSMQLR